MERREPVKRREMWKRDEVQFPRLLAEIDAVAPLARWQIDELCKSMDLKPAEIRELFDRAEASWQRIKGRIIRRQADRRDG